jgi:ERCC4-type nuclease
MILVDDRIGSAEMLPLFQRGKAELSRLDFGDFAFVGNGRDSAVMVGIERKTVTDFLAGYDTGRFNGYQLGGLMHSYGVVYVIIEGMFRRSPTSGLLELINGHGWDVPKNGRKWMFREFVCTINSLAMCPDMNPSIQVITTMNKHDTVAWVEALHHWWTEKEYKDHQSHVNLYRGPSFAELVNPTLLRKMLYCFKGIGFEKMRLLEKEFSSVQDMVNAGPERWAKVKGISKRMADEIVKEIRNE